MVKETTRNMPQRKTSIAIEIPRRRGLSQSNIEEMRARTYEQPSVILSKPQLRRKVSNPIPITYNQPNMENNSYNNRNQVGHYEEDEDNNDCPAHDIVPLRQPVAPKTSIENRYTRNLIINSRNRKTSVVFGQKPSSYFENVKKKKSSSGVSSSSSDNNFPLTSFNEKEEVDLIRKCSEFSLDEISSNDTSPAGSRKTSEKKLSDTDYGYSSLKEKRTPKHSSVYHKELTKKIAKNGKDTTSSRIGLYENRISTEQKSSFSVYDRRGRKKQPKTEEKLDDRNRSTDTFNWKDGFHKRSKSMRERSPDRSSVKTEKIKRSISEKIVASLFTKKNKNQGTNFTDNNNKVTHPTSKPSLTSKLSNANKIVESLKPPIRKLSQTISPSAARRKSTSSRHSDERKLSFAEIQRKFSATTFEPRRRGSSNVELVDQSTQTDIGQRSFVTNTPQQFTPYQNQPSSPPKPSRRRTLPYNYMLTETIVSVQTKVMFII